MLELQLLLNFPTHLLLQPSNMKSFNVLLCFMLSCLCILSIDASSRLTGNETDRLALLSIKRQITYDPFGVMNSWNDSFHHCSWPGITCSTRHQRVTMLDLSSKQLVGTLVPQIGNMSFLRQLILQNNTFSGGIPHEIGRLFRLQNLVFKDNSFTGEIPVELSNCSKLIYLDLDGNGLTGKIPVELGLSLRNLQELFLRSNNLTGELPYSLGNLSSLVALAAPENRLEGSIPNSLGQLTNLSYISLGANMLSGAIPPSVFNLSSLYHLAAPVNQLKGSLPPDIGSTLPSLRLLYLHSNLLSGVLPSSISNLTKLEIISISRNQLSGKIPSLENLHNLQGLSLHFNNLGTGKEDDMDFFSSLANITSFTELSLSVNNIGGQLPKNIGNFSANFRSIGFARNKLFGRIPDGLVECINMEVVSLEYNQLTGELPVNLGKLQKLNYFYVKGNKLSGEIPSSIGNLTSLYGLNLAQNNLEGTIPSVLGKCQLLQMLYLSQNRLSGTIPKEVLSISSLSIQLDLSGNQLSGSLPLEVGSLVNLGNLDISENKLSGKLPSTLGSCIRLENLYVQGNMFEGVIPPSLTSLKGLVYLDLSRNNFSGLIPKYLETFTSLKSLNLSYNNFGGEVPLGGVFNNASGAIISGNRNLCGGSPVLKLQLCKVPMSKKGRLSPTMKIVISVACGLFGVTLILVLIALWFLKRKHSPSPDIVDDSFLKISYGELLKATNGFSSENFIGKGGFGSVYKGILGPDGKTVAIKVLDLQHRGALKSFIAECEVLKNLRHRNLVKLVTACSGTDYQGNDFKALIYEYMFNGSLEDWLYSISDSESQQIRYLDFHQRVDVALDIAFALDYLHDGSQTPVVHCDLKPSNVLLDKDMTARVGDFGLSRFLQEPTQQTSARETSTIGIKGSIGYAAPEYGMGSEVSIYGDIYSYGIIILEMITGKKPTDDVFSNGLNLHNYAKLAFSTNEVMEIVDPMLCHSLQEEEATNSIAEKKTKDHVAECLISMCKIGIACTMESPKERMGINDVVRELQLVKETLVECDEEHTHQHGFYASSNDVMSTDADPIYPPT